MDFKQEQPKKRPSAVTPVLGFILLLLIGAGAWFAAPAVIQWLQTTTLSLGYLGDLLPLDLPDEWPPALTQGIIALLLFIFIFTILVVLFMLFSRPPEKEEFGQYAAYVKEAEKKKRRSRRRR